MQPRNRLATVYLVAAGVLFIGIMLLQGYIWPPPPPAKKATIPETMSLYVGAAADVALHKDIDVFGKVEVERTAQFPSALGNLAGAITTAAVGVDAPGLVAQERRDAIAKKADPDELIPLGWGEKPFHVRVLLNQRGASIQQVILNHFQQADREGLAVKNEDGSPKPLHLIPGVVVPRTEKLRDQREVPVPKLGPGKVTLPASEVAHPSYVMYHYDKENDPQPVDTLGRRQWAIVRNEATSDDTHVVVFETELGAPHYLKITKTYTLSRDDYHVGLAFTLTPTPRPPGAKVEPFRYQIDGPRNTPIEGEWYTTLYRQGIVGWPGSRALEMPQDVRHHDGSDRFVARDGKPIKYAGVLLQYFASVLAVDNIQPDGQAADYIEYVRFTPEGPSNFNQEKKLDQTFLDDLTFRAISKKLEITAPVTHSYVLYQGPAKIRLLKQLEGDQAVSEETVNRYRDDLGMKTLTDAPSPNWLGRFASFIFWSDIVIAFTNLIHSLLGLLTHGIPNMGICILIITVVVRGLLHPLTRRQAINAKIMQAKTSRLSPEVKKLTEKYGDDFNRLNQEKMKLYREHGINPAAALGGCLPLLMQMPVFMGLYFALQESVFFRLEPATPWWILNLAAPDMLVWWSEEIPWLSAPDSLGGMLYLGPYFNLLPLIAVGLMMYVQNKMMPKSEDPQVQMQQKTMKFMMILMLLFFYKSPAGLAIYFIASSIWGIIERQLLPKDIEKLEAQRAERAAKRAEARAARGPSNGWLGKKMAGWKERWSQLLEDAQKQQQAQRDQRPQAPKGPAPNGPPGPQGPGKKKKKR